jgi:hypothetical protein
MRCACARFCSCASVPRDGEADSACEQIMNWIDSPVHVLVSSLLNTDPNAPPDVFISTRSIGEFVLNVLNASMPVKTNMTTTIVRKFKAHDAKIHQFGLFVRTVGQKPEKTYLVQKISTIHASSGGRGSHTNSRGTSYYWALSRVPAIIGPMVRAVRGSRAFRNVVFQDRSAASAAGGGALVWTPVGSPPQNGELRSPTRTNANHLPGAAGIALSRSLSIPSTASYDQLHSPPQSPPHGTTHPASATSAGFTFGRALSVSSEMGNLSVADPRDDRKVTFSHHNGGAAGTGRLHRASTASTSGAGTELGEDADANAVFAGSSASSAIIGAALHEARRDDLRARIDNNRKIIEELNSKLVGLLFEVAQDEMALRELEQQGMPT